MPSVMHGVFFGVWSRQRKRSPRTSSQALLLIVQEQCSLLSKNNEEDRQAVEDKEGKGDDDLYLGKNSMKKELKQSQISAVAKTRNRHVSRVWTVPCLIFSVV